MEIYRARREEQLQTTGIAEPHSRCLSLIGTISSRRFLISDSTIHPLSPTSGTRPHPHLFTLATHLHPCPCPNRTDTHPASSIPVFTIHPKRQSQRLLAYLAFWSAPQRPVHIAPTHLFPPFGYPLAPNSESPPIPITCIDVGLGTKSPILLTLLTSALIPQNLNRGHRLSNTLTSDLMGWGPALRCSIVVAPRLRSSFRSLCFSI
ncbi:hypothetical protein BJY52DRAFT_325767 [Lactarius psammicola]|nr:hypothetical protein BJY52DRAFT_325767 [Lactarius psammicola]